MTKIEEDIDLESLEYERYPDDTGSVSVDKDVLNRPEFALLKEAIDENMKEFYHRILRAEHYHGSMCMNQVINVLSISIAMPVTVACFTLMTDC